MAPSLWRAQKIDITARIVHTATKGRAKTNLHGLVEMGVSKSSSSFMVRSLAAGRVSVTSSGNKRALKDSKPRDTELRSCVNRDGINVLTTRLEIYRLFFRTLRALRSSAGWIRRVAIANISSLAYPGSFAKRYPIDRSNAPASNWMESHGSDHQLEFARRT